MRYLGRFWDRLGEPRGRPNDPKTTPWGRKMAQKGAKTEPKTRTAGLKTTQEAAKTAHKTTKIDQKIVFKNDPVLERS